MTFTLDPALKTTVRTQLAPTGRLRAAINMSNFLLVSGTGENNQPEGVSPSLAQAIANELGVELALLPYKGPGDIADDALNNQWDIANIAAEPERAKTINFSPAYSEIQATYLLPPDSPITTIDAVDKPGVRISVKQRSAYDLWLTENLQHATLVRSESLDDSFSTFRDQQLDVLAGLRPKLLEQQSLMPGATLFDTSFTAVQQSVGCQIDKPAAAAYLTDFVGRAISTGLVQSLIERFAMTGRLSVAS